MMVGDRTKQQYAKARADCTTKDGGADRGGQSSARCRGRPCAGKTTNFQRHGDRGGFSFDP